jgi:hypothetical protein
MSYFIDKARASQSRLPIYNRCGFEKRSNTVDKESALIRRRTIQCSKNIESRGHALMDKCVLCSGRMIKSVEGRRCMNSACEGSKIVVQEGLMCEDCDEAMSYTGLNSWGEPNYSCIHCGSIAKL